MSVQATLPIGSYETVASCPIGTPLEVGPRKYRYVKYVDAVTYVVGHVCAPKATAYNVTNDISGALEARFAGCVPNLLTNGSATTTVPTEGQFGWLQVSGPHSAVVTNADDDIAAGDTLIVDDNEDGQCDSVAGATDTGDLRLMGYAAAADVDASDTVSAILCNSVYA
jgi:hypothetical protein